jgi:hypothetical protein
MTRDTTTTAFEYTKIPPLPSVVRGISAYEVCVDGVVIGYVTKYRLTLPRPLSSATRYGRTMERTHWGATLVRRTAEPLAREDHVGSGYESRHAAAQALAAKVSGTL